MTDNQKPGDRQLSLRESVIFADRVMQGHELRFVSRGNWPVELKCSCGVGFPVLGLTETALLNCWNTHMNCVTEEAASRIGFGVHRTWRASGDDPVVTKTAADFERPSRRPYYLGVEWRAVPLWAMKEAYKYLNGINKGEQLMFQPIGLTNLFWTIIDANEHEPDPTERAAATLKERLLMETNADAPLWSGKSPPVLDDEDRPGALVPFSMNELVKIAEMAEADALSVDNPAIYEGIAITAREHIKRIAMATARDTLRDAHFTVCNSYDPDADRETVYSEPLAMINKAMGLDWDEATP